MASIISAGTTSGTALNMAGDTSGVLELATNGSTTALTIDTSQNVGIGTTSPFSAAGYKSLTINGSTTGILAIQANGSNSCYLYSDGGAFNIKGVQNIPMDFYTNDTYRMRIDSSGNVLFNTTDTTLFNNTSGNGVCYRANASLDVAASSDNCLILNRMTSTGQIAEFRYAGNVVGNISTNGSNCTFNSTSDYRLKENIAPITGALNKVAQLKPVSYTWKVDGSDGQGFIAHELQAIVPECVSGEKDAVDAEGNPKYQGIDTSFLVATLTAAIQEMKAIIDEQSVTINDLKARITALEGAA